MGVLCPVCHPSNITMILATTFSRSIVSTCTLIHAPCKFSTPVLLSNHSQNRAKLAFFPSVIILSDFMSIFVFGGNEKQIVHNESSTHHDEEMNAQMNNHNLLLTQYLSDSKMTSNENQPQQRGLLRRPHPRRIHDLPNKHNPAYLLQRDLTSPQRPHRPDPRRR